MRCVKRLFILMLPICAVSGCADSQLARFAPPGIIKYEDIASEKPANPAITARVEERRADPEAGDFPRLANTPGESDRPDRRPQAELDAEREVLVSARDGVADGAIRDRREADADKADREALEAQGETLKIQVEKDSALSARERQQQSLPTIDEQ